VATPRAGSPPVGLDDLSKDGFLAVVAPLFENAPRFLDRLAAGRPYRSAERLFDRARAIARSMPEDEQVELIDAHPRLGAAPATVSRHSYVEQGYDRPAPPSTAEDPETAAELEALNAAYEERFGFRYCVFVAGRPRSALIPGMREALGADRSDEIDRALTAVIDIAEDRWAKRLASRDEP
jgi:2-oxo-4-hydroxy-4-carboxy--5-ureidoimidazoline (OHCU) decarboxylase